MATILSEEFVTYKYVSKLKLIDTDIRLMTKIFNKNTKQNDLLSLVLVTADDMVFGYGHNANGCLGINSASTEVKRCTPVKALCGKNVIKLCSGNRFVVTLTKSGLCYSWGDNKFGQLGLSKNTTSVNKPILIESLKNVFVVDVACGLYHVLLLTNSYDVYAFGSNVTGAIGNGTTFHQMKPYKLTQLEQINCRLASDVIEIATGGWHSASINLKGELFVWGWNQDGQCGMDDCPNNHLIPKRIELSCPFKSVKCGLHHTLALTYDGLVYAFGSNEFGECAQQNKKVCTVPMLVDAIDEPTIEIGTVAKSRISIAFTKNNLFVWGQTNSETHSHQPKKIALSQQIDYNRTLNKILSKFEKHQYCNDHKNISVKFPFERMLITTTESSKQNNLSTIFNNCEETDLIITLNVNNENLNLTNNKIEQKIFVQRILLELYSEFMQLFPKKFCEPTSGGKETGDDIENYLTTTTITIRGNKKKFNQLIVRRDIPFTILYAYLYYQYSNRLILQQSMLIQLLQMCDELNMKTIVDACQLYIMEHYNIENICHLFTIAVKYQLQFMCDYCVQWIDTKIPNDFCWKQMDLNPNRIEHCDLQLLCNNNSNECKYSKRTIYCHKLILYYYGNLYQTLQNGNVFFEKLYMKNHVTSKEQFLLLEQIDFGELCSLKTIEYYIEYLYHRKLKLINMEAIVDLLKFVTIVKHEQLRLFCIEQLSLKLNIENICHFYMKYCADDVQEENIILKELCLKIAGENIATLFVSSDFRRLLLEQGENPLGKFLLNISNYCKLKTI